MRFFISFSSRDKAVVREIMAGIHSQGIEFWDYSDENWAIDLSEEIKERLISEIRECDFFVPVVSKNSVNETTGHFTRFEVDYAIRTQEKLKNHRVLTIELEGITHADYTGPYVPLKDCFHYEFIWNEDKGVSIRSYIGLIKKICRAVNITYVPQITPHHRMPFWERFRDEIFSYSHKISSHVGLMGCLGEFNEYFKHKSYEDAYKSISYFLMSCDYFIPESKLLYPWIVKGITEQFMGNHQKAIESYQKAREAEENNPDALAGLGLAYRFTGDYSSSVACYEKAFLHSTGIRKVNMRLNIIYSKVAGQVLPTPEERDFIIKLNADQTVALDIEELDKRGILPSPDDSSEEAVTKRKNIIAERTAEEKKLILTAKALTWYIEAKSQINKIPDKEFRKLMLKAYEIFRYDYPEEEITEKGLIFYYYLSARYLKLNYPEEILLNAIRRSAGSPVINAGELNKLLAEHYFGAGNYLESIKIYENISTAHFDDLRIAMYYAAALKKAGNQKYISVCQSVLGKLPSGYPAFYWAGFANYLLGNTTYARHDFERSNHFGPYYDRLV